MGGIFKTFKKLGEMKICICIFTMLIILQALAKAWPMSAILGQSVLTWCCCLFMPHIW